MLHILLLVHQGVLVLAQILLIGISINILGHQYHYLSQFCNIGLVHKQMQDLFWAKVIIIYMIGNAINSLKWKLEPVLRIMVMEIFVDSVLL